MTFSAVTLIISNSANVEGSLELYSKWVPTWKSLLYSQWVYWSNFEHFLNQSYLTLLYIYFYPVLEIVDNYYLFLSLRFHDFEIVWSNKNSFYFPYLDFPPQISFFELCTFSLFPWSMKALHFFLPIYYIMQIREWLCKSFLPFWNLVVVEDKVTKI